MLQTTQRGCVLVRPTIRDPANAAGWYAAAGKAPPPEALSPAAEWEAIAADVLGRRSVAAAARATAREAGLAARAAPTDPLPGVHIRVTNTLGAPAAATVAVPGLRRRRRLRVVHISDSHLDLGPDEASGSAGLCRFMAEAYRGGRKAEVTRGLAGAAPLAAFERQVAIAAEAGADLIVHTGDLLNFPSPRAAARAAAVLHASGTGWLFVAGNHDWCVGSVHLPPFLGPAPSTSAL